MLQHMGIHVVLSVLLLMLGNKSEQASTELEVLGVNITQKEMKVKENSLFNLTFRLHKFTCHEKWNWSRVKLSANDNGKHFDVCKMIVMNGTCTLSGSSQCVCLHEGFVQFTKRVTQEDSQIFIWKWSDSPSLSNEKEKEIILFVEPAEHVDLSKHLKLIKPLIVGFVIGATLAAIVGHKLHSRALAVSERGKVVASDEIVRGAGENTPVRGVMPSMSRTHQQHVESRNRITEDNSENVASSVLLD